MQQRRRKIDGDVFFPVYKEFYLQGFSVRNHSDVHYDNTKRVLDRFTVYQNLTFTRLNEIQDLEFEEYIAQRQKDKYRDKPIKTVSLNNEIKILNTCFAKAGPKEPRGPARANYGFLQWPPFMNQLEEDELDPVAVTEDQIEMFSLAASFAKSPNIEGCTPAQFWRAALLLAIVTGLRRASLLAIERPSDEVLRGDKILILPGSKHKTKNSLRIPLGSDAVVDVLMDLPTKEGEPILPWKSSRTGKPMSHGHFSNTMAEIQREAGIPEDQRVLTKHFRSTSGTLIYEEFNEEMAKKWLGHSPTSKTFLKHYKAKRVSKKDRLASEFLGEYALPHVVTKPKLNLYGA